MFTAVAFVPVAPVLILGPAVAVKPTLAAVDRALAPLATLGLPVHLLVAAPPPAQAGFTLAALGAPQSDDRPWRVSVAETLLQRHGLTAGCAREVGPGAALVEPAEAACLVVAGDGSAKRSESAPGALDPRAEGFDATVLTAINQADPMILAGLDAGLGEALLVDAVHVWRSAGAALGDRRWRAAARGELNAPFGVAYLTGAWIAGQP